MSETFRVTTYEGDEILSWTVRAADALEALHGVCWYVGIDGSLMPDVVGPDQWEAVDPDEAVYRITAAPVAEEDLDVIVLPDRGQGWCERVVGAQPVMPALQLRSAWFLADRFGHAWARRLPRTTFDRCDGARTRRAIEMQVLESQLATGGDGGVIAPDYNRQSQCIEHVTGGGRFSWSVSPRGEVAIAVSRRHVGEVIIAAGAPCAECDRIECPSASWSVAQMRGTTPCHRHRTSMIWALEPFVGPERARRLCEQAVPHPASDLPEITSSIEFLAERATKPQATARDLLGVIAQIGEELAAVEETRRIGRALQRLVDHDWQA